MASPVTTAYLRVSASLLLRKQNLLRSLLLERRLVRSLVRRMIFHGEGRVAYPAVQACAMRAQVQGTLACCRRLQSDCCHGSICVCQLPAMAERGCVRLQRGSVRRRGWRWRMPQRIQTAYAGEWPSCRSQPPTTKGQRPAPAPQSAKPALTFVLELERPMVHGRQRAQRIQRRLLSGWRCPSLQRCRGHTVRERPATGKSTGPTQQCHGF